MLNFIKFLHNNLEAFRNYRRVGTFYSFIGFLLFTIGTTIVTEVPFSVKKNINLESNLYEYWSENLFKGKNDIIEKYKNFIGCGFLIISAVLLTFRNPGYKKVFSAVVCGLILTYPTILLTRYLARFEYFHKIINKNEEIFYIQKSFSNWRWVYLPLNRFPAYLLHDVENDLIDKVEEEAYRSGQIFIEKMQKGFSNSTKYFNLLSILLDCSIKDLSNYFPDELCKYNIIYANEPVQQKELDMKVSVISNNECDISFLAHIFIRMFENYSKLSIDIWNDTSALRNFLNNYKKLDDDYEWKEPSFYIIKHWTPWTPPASQEIYPGIHIKKNMMLIHDF